MSSSSTITFQSSSESGSGGGSMTRSRASSRAALGFWLAAEVTDLGEEVAEGRGGGVFGGVGARGGCPSPACECAGAGDAFIGGGVLIGPGVVDGELGRAGAAGLFTATFEDALVR